MQDTLQFEHIYLIWIGLVICIVSGFLLHLANRRRDRDLAKLISAKLMPGVTDSISVQRRLIRQGIWLVSLFLLFASWARPQKGFEEREIKQKGIDLIFAIDTSQSMMAEDIAPNRLERAKIAITDFVDRLEGDRVALIPFAGKAFSLCPLTSDYSAFHQSLDVIDINTIPHLGTDISMAVAEANRLFDEQKNSYRILILITDGEDLQGDIPRALAEAQKKNMKIFTVGVGSPQGAKIPINYNGYQEYVRDQQGELVITRLDESTLEKVAIGTGGSYAPLGQSGQGLNQIYQEKLSLVPRQELDKKMERIPIERYHWPLTIAVILLLIEFLLSERSRRIAWLAKLNPRKLLPHSAAVFALITMMHSYTHADARKTYNNGTKAYQEENYEKANRLLQKSIKETSDLELQQKAYYNIGNARYRIAQKSLNKPNKETIKTLKQSIKAFEDSLQLNPNDTDAQYNRDFIQKVLDELEDQQNQDQQNQDQQNQDQQNQDQQNQDQQNQDQQNQDQQNQDQQNQDQQNQDQQNQDQQNQDQQNQDQQNQDQQNQDQQNQDQQETRNGIDEQRHARPEESAMTEEQAKQLLESLRKDEATVVPLPSMRQYRRSVPNNTTRGKTW